MQMTQRSAALVLAEHSPLHVDAGPDTPRRRASITCLCNSQKYSPDEFADHQAGQLAFVAEVVQETVNSGWTPDCGCAQCQTDRAAHKAWPDSLARTMALCSECGNKRCPKATWHVNECTGSNEPGQPGSAYVL